MNSSIRAIASLGHVELACGAVVIVVSGLLVYAGLIPYAEAQAADAFREQQLANSTKLGEQLTSFREGLDTRLDALRREQASLPTLGDSRQLSLRLAEFNALAGRHGLIVDELSPRPPAPDGPLQSTPVRVVGSSGYVALAAFLDELHRTMPDVVVRGFGLSQTARAETDESIFMIELAFYAVSTGETSPE